MKARKIIKAGFNRYYKTMREQYFKRVEICENHIILLHKRYTQNFSHWYIGPIGVDSKYKGKGFASKLLKPKLTECEEQNIPCYLETHNEQNIPIYMHFGFDVVEESIIPGTNLPIWAMLRK